jgi:hypothetical protein
MSETGFEDMTDDQLRGVLAMIPPSMLRVFARSAEPVPAPDETTGFTQAVAMYRAMGRIQLIEELRTERWRADAARDRAAAIQPAADAIVADAQRQLNRVWSLVDHKHKTLRMDDLRAALLSEEPAETGSQP